MGLYWEKELSWTVLETMTTSIEFVVVGVAGMLQRKTTLQW